MSKKKFNPAEWQNTNQGNHKNLDKITVQTNNPRTDIEIITKRIEETNTDIAPNYADWRDLGFALADALGESGRNYYHRLSRFYPKYNQTETDKQYNNCLKAHGHGVTIKTLYHLAKSAGVNISISEISKLPNVQNGNLAKCREQSSNSFETMPSIAGKSRSN
ncbi:MAG: PriCT-2 domain-containing protein, partial [Prevotellaceae bacterium]|nr:PriCT-2 domain-containing protein [Prevotellaceae bacterium]